MLYRNNIHSYQTLTHDYWVSHHAAGSVAVGTVMQQCVMIGSRQIFVGKWYYMNAYIRTSMCSIPLTTMVNGMLCTSLMGHTAKSVSGHHTHLLNG